MAKPVGVGDVLGLAGVGEIGEGLGHSGEDRGCETDRGLDVCRQVGFSNGSSAARGMLGWIGAVAGGAVGRGPPIELVVEDGFDGAVGLKADFDSAGRPPRRAHLAVGTGETDDAETARYPARDGAGPPGSARTGPWSPGRSFGRLPGCARSSSRRSADGWKACARERWCASGSACP